MKLAAVFLAIVALAGAARAMPTPVASADVVRNGDRWTVDFRLDAEAPAWVFARSDLPRVERRSWRLESMEVLTAGVRLERVGHYDVLVADEGNVPSHVRMRFTPFTADIETGYDAALAFSDGSVALYSQQFKLVPMVSRDAVRSAPIDSAEIPAAARPTAVRFRDLGGPVLARGKRQPEFQAIDEDAYVLFGDAEPVFGASLTTIIDPALPEWLRNFITGEMPRILASYAKTLGPPPTGQPMLMVSWAGPTSGLTSMGGSVLTGTVVMTFEGEGVLQHNDSVLESVRWFVAHESAHFWLGQVVAYEGPRDSWITEGGADLLAIRAVQAADPAQDAGKHLRASREECLPFLAKGGVASANERGDHRAYYSCGVMIGLAAEQASGGDFAEFVRTLIARSGGDGTITRAEWLALLEERAPGMSAEVERLLDQAHPDPAAALERFAKKGGISLMAGTASGQ